MQARWSRALQALFIGVLLTGASATASAAGYYVRQGKIYRANGQELQIKGISHFGFNSTTLQPQYLWQMGWKEQIAQMKSLGFNAIRVPFVPDTLYNGTPVDQLSYVDPVLNPELLGKTPLQVLDLWIAEADRQGMHIMLDFHSVSKHQQYPTWWLSNPADYHLIYNQRAYTEANWIRDLQFVAARYAHISRFFAVDLYNEPNGQVRWSTGDPNVTDSAYYWKRAVEAASAAVLQSNPNVLIFVQGIAGNFDGREDSNIPINWGEDFQPQAYQPLNIPTNKLVLTPHTYGPDVYMKATFGEHSFPANLPEDWEALFGRFYPAHAVVPGEWGGRYGTGPSGEMDVTWQNAFVQYMAGKGMRNSFYWCYTPNSTDTGGILNDDLTVRQDKVSLLKKHWAKPKGGSETPAPVPPDPEEGAPATPPVEPAEADAGAPSGGAGGGGGGASWLLPFLTAIALGARLSRTRRLAAR
jgi:aryl-phospho-beta-D-glucosidase BglC (GH1 family)